VVRSLILTYSGLLSDSLSGYTYDGRYVCRNSGWYDWGRWVAFAVIVGCAFIIFFLFA
jgi:hypothetical protein